MSQNLNLPDLIQQGQLPPHSEEKNVVSQINRYNQLTWPHLAGGTERAAESVA